MLQLTKRLILLGIGAFVCVVFGSVLLGNLTVYAHNGSSNAAEAAAPGECATNVRYTLWVSGSSSFSHSQSATMGDVTADSAWLYLYRSAYGCTKVNGPMSAGVSITSLTITGANPYGLTLSSVPTACLAYSTNSGVAKGKYTDFPKSSSAAYFKINNLTKIPYGGSTTITLTLGRKNCSDGSTGTTKSTLTVTRPAPWVVTPSISVSPTSVRRGQTVTWTHKIQANSYNPPSVSWGYADNDTTGTYKPVADSKTAWSSDLGASSSKTNNSPTYTIPNTATHGQTVCRMTYVNPYAWNNSGRVASSQACATVYVPDWDIASSNSLSASQIDYLNSETATWTFGFYKYSGQHNDGDNKTGSFGYDDVRVAYNNTNPGSGNYHSLYTALNIGTYYNSANQLKTTKTLTGNNANHNNTDPNNLTRAGVSDVGYNICRRATFQPNKWDNTGWESSGWLCTRIISKWSVTPSSKAENTTTNPTAAPNNTDLRAKPYDEIKYTHTLTGNNHILKNTTGADVTVKGTVYQTELGTFKGSTLSLTAANSNGNASGTNSFEVNPNGDEIGKKVCQYMTVDKKQWDNNSALTGNQTACVYIPYNYELKPTVTGTAESNQEAGAQISISKSMLVDTVQGTNPNSKYETKTVDGVTTRITCTTNGNAGCAGWNETASVTTNISYYSSTFSGSVGDSVIYTIPVNSAIGTEYCFYTKVDNYGKVISGSNQGAITSSKKCYRVIKGPTLQIWGAESWAGNGNDSGFQSKDPSDQVNVVSATWSQYGLFSVGSIDEGFGSGGWIKPLSRVNLEKSKRLKFASDPTGGDYIGVDDNHNLTDMFTYYSARFGNTKDFSSADMAAILNGSRPVTTLNTKTIWYGEGDKTLTGSLPMGRDLVIIVNGSLTINSNISMYDGSYTSLANLPNLTIVAKGHIILNPNVERLDGIYYAGSTIFDCGNTAYIGDYQHNDIFDLNNTCYRQLKVNGALIANQFRFQRTYGSQNIYDSTPAEIVSYPASIWLQEYNYRKGLSSSVPTMFYRELAPRV